MLSQSRASFIIYSYILHKAQPQAGVKTFVLYFENLFENLNRTFLFTD